MAREDKHVLCAVFRDSARRDFWTMKTDTFEQAGVAFLHSSWSEILLPP